MNICFATNNNNKLLEIRSMVPKGIQLLSLQDIGCDEKLPETKNTLEDNSLQKAQFVYDHYEIDCFADDTGLEVKALNNQPGVFSARYAGPQRSSDDNIQLLLKNLQGIEDRRARFRTVISLIVKGRIWQFEGVIHGEIITEKRGIYGFGYDPVFVPANKPQSFAEIPFKEKNLISHRARAFKKLMDHLNSMYKPSSL